MVTEIRASPHSYVGDTDPALSAPGGVRPFVAPGFLAKLLWWEPIWIALLAPSVLFPGRFWALEWHPTLVLLLFLFWPLRLLATRRLFGRTPLVWSTAFFVAWLAVGVAFSIRPAHSWEWAGYVALGVALFVALENWPTTITQPQRIAWLLLTGGIGLAVLGPLFVDAIPDKFGMLSGSRPIGGGTGIALGETLNPNVMAGGLVLVVPLALALVLQSGWTRSIWLRFFTALTATLLLGALLWSQSRGAYFGLLGSLACLVILRRPRLAYALAAILLVSGLGFSSMGGASVAYGWLGDTTGELAWRMQIWMRAIIAIHDFPLTGLGFGLFGVLVPVLYPFYSVGSAPAHTHNLYLQIGADMGVPGLVAMGAIWLGTGTMLLNILRAGNGFLARDSDATAKERAQLQRGLAMGGLAALCAMWAHGLVDAVLWSSKLAFLPWLLYALAACLYMATVPCSDEGSTR